jgi:hypothetical protein
VTDPEKAFQAKMWVLAIAVVLAFPFLFLWDWIHRLRIRLRVRRMFAKSSFRESRQEARIGRKARRRK